MNEIDLEKIKQRFSEVEQALSLIQKYTQTPEKKFWQDERNMLSTKQLLLQAAEALGSVCIHIASKSLHVGVSEYGECFEKLLNANIINKELTLKLRKFIRFRNMLVHRYWEIDDKKVFQYVRRDIKDLEDFIKSINKWLTKQK